MKHFYFLLPLMLWCGIAGAQNKYAGAYYVYDYKNAPAMTPAPEGYRPFYISHFARHGARYCTSEYETLYTLLSKAGDNALLTEEGKTLCKRYLAFYRKVKVCAGNLTGTGKAQHRAIAGHMFARFPTVFEGPTHVEAVSTESPRVIMSMWSCLSELQSLDRDIAVKADASAKYCSWLQPNLKSNPHLIKGAYAHGRAAQEASRAFFMETVPWKEIVARYFTEEDALEQLKSSPEQFIGLLHSIAADTYCLDTDQGCFDDIFSEEESAAIWRAGSHLARYEVSESLAADYAAYTLEQIIQSADADIASGGTQLRLRFGHDAALAPLIALMDVNGFGRTATTIAERAEFFPSYEVPMGCSLQLIFFRNASGDILVKVLLNEAEATLPFPAVSGPYYNWEDFKAHYWPVVRASKYRIAAKEPLAALKDVD